MTCSALPCQCSEPTVGALLRIRTLLTGTQSRARRRGWVVPLGPRSDDRGARSSRCLESLLMHAWGGCGVQPRVFNPSSRVTTGRPCRPAALPSLRPRCPAGPACSCRGPCVARKMIDSASTFAGRRYARATLSSFLAKKRGGTPRMCRGETQHRAVRSRCARIAPREMKFHRGTWHRPTSREWIESSSRPRVGSSASASAECRLWPSLTLPSSSACDGSWPAHERPSRLTAIYLL